MELFIPLEDEWPKETPTGSQILCLLNHKPGIDKEQPPGSVYLIPAEKYGPGYYDTQTVLKPGRALPEEYLPLRLPDPGKPPIATFKLKDGWIFDAAFYEGVWVWNFSSGYREHNE